MYLSDHLWILGVIIMAPVALWGMLSRKQEENYARKVLKTNIESGQGEPISLHPEIDPAKCAGCGACTKACPEGDILKMIDHKAVLVSPTQCVGHGECEKACPFDAISLVFGTKTRGVDIPRLSSNYETDVKGLYIAGELGGMGLIRNAVRQGHMAAKDALKKISSRTKSDTDILIVGAGPAGLSAALTAIAEKKRYIVVEQNSFGGTVYNFPRQKIVMTRAAVLPLVGEMKFENDKVSKEQLLSFWKKVVKKTGMIIKNQVKFESLKKDGDIFTVKTSAGTITSQKVVLAMGLRGSPRRLGLANEDSRKVSYNLKDPEQYQGMDVAVVGGGNAAAEAVIMLAKREYNNRVTMIVRGPVLDRCNEQNKKRILSLAERNRIQLWWESSVTAIEKNHLDVNRNGTPTQIPNQYLFIYAGAEMPFQFLMSLGVSIDKKFGERRKAPRT